MGCTISHKDGIIKRIGLNRRLQSDQDNFNENSPRAPQLIHDSVYHQDEKPIVRFGFERDTDSVKNALVDFMALNALPSVDTDNAVLNEHSVAWGQATTGGGSPASFTIAGEGSVEGVPTELQYICGTGVSFEWLFQRLIEKFKCPDEPPPQWIVEKLNVVGGKDLDKTTVMKVTFGWDNEKLPKSVVLKICETHEDDSPAEAKLASKMFRRECHAYEWLCKQRKMCVPKVYVIKKQSSESCNALIVMEDLSERSIIGDLGEGISVEGVRDMLRILAQFHALSMHKTEWMSLVSEHPPFFYEQMARFVQAVAKQWSVFDDDTFTKLEHLMTHSYISSILSESCSHLHITPCLVHGNPAARNIFLTTNQKKMGAVIDWTQAHPGCYGEDIAKAICWNLTAKERHTHLLKLLQFYHYNLVKKFRSVGGQNTDEITLEQVKSAYQRFMPLATITFLMFLPEDMNRVDANLLERGKHLFEDALMPMEINGDNTSDH